MLKFQPQVGDAFKGLYPVHGSMNVLRTVQGEVVKVGETAKNGPFITVQESEDKIRSLSTKKIVQLH